MSHINKLSGRRKKSKRNRGSRIKEGKPGISLCMIVRDEQEGLPRCIKSVRGILSEIVVVDTGSSDDTAAVARGLGAKVIPYHWSNDFSAARNVSLKNASQKWILVLDADEVIDQADLPEIAALCRHTEFRAFEFVTRNYVLESNWSNWVPNDGKSPESLGYPGWFPSKKVRLFLNHERVHYRGEIHELVEPSLKELNWKVKRVHIPIHHFMLEKPQQRQRRKRELYRECARKKVLSSPQDPKALYEYGLHCSETEQYARAVKAFSEALNVAPDFTDRYPGLTNIHGHLGANLIKLNLYQEALSRVEEGMRQNPGNCDLLHLQGISYLALGCEKEAISALEKAVEVNPGFSKAHHTLGVACHRAGENDKAARALRKALELNPRMSEAALLLSKMQDAGYTMQDKENHESGMVKLSVCIIVRDEEDSLPGCIESIRGIADEIVVVDTGSTDGTVQRAKALGARVFHFPWCDDFSAARNESIRHARGDYILWMDADDRLHADDAMKLKLIKENLPQLAVKGSKAYIPSRYGINGPNLYTADQKKVAYLFLLQNQKNGIDDDVCYQLRLFPNLPGVAFQGRVHEQVVYSLEKLGVEQHEAEIKIVHQGYSQRSKMEAKVRRNIELLLQEEKSQPGDFTTHFQLAGSYFFIGEVERAVEHMEKAVHGENDHRRSRFWHLLAYVQLGWMYKMAGRKQRALETLQEALAMDPGNGLARFFVGEIKYSMGQYREALDAFSSISDESFRLTVFALPINRIRYSLRFHRGRCHEELGDYDEAVRQYRMALAIDPDSASAKKHLSTVYLKQGSYREAEEILGAGASGHSPLAETEDPALLTNLGLILSWRGDTIRAEQMYRKALALNPHLSEARVNLGHLLLREGRFQEARLQLEQAAQHNGTWIDVHLGLSCAMAAEGDIEGCVRECDTLLGLLQLPRNHTLDKLADLGDLYLLIGKKLNHEGRRAEAVLALSTAALLNPQNTDFFVHDIGDSPHTPD